MTTPGGIFDEASLGELRALKRLGMTATCTVLRKPAYQEGATGNAASTTPVAVAGLIDLPCGFRPEGVPVEVPVADAMRAARRYTVEFDVEDFAVATESIRPADQLQITHQVRGLASPMLLNVIGDAPKAADEVSRKVLAERLTRGG